MCRPWIMAMLMSPINTGSHSCAVSWPMKTSKSLYHATVAFGGRCTVVISRCLACGNDTCTTSPSNASFSKSRRRLYDTLSWIVRYTLMGIYRNSTSIPLSPIVSFNAISLHGYFTISMAVVQPCYGDTQDMYVVAPGVENMSHLFDFVI